MALAAHSAEATTARAALIDPPLGMVTIELGKDDVSLVFSDGEHDRVPRDTVRAIEREDRELTADWAGTPVMLSFETTADSTRVFENLRNARSFASPSIR